MPLTPGTRLGPYEIVAPLGAGGMGEVWRARDTRLGRDVAVKVLPEHLSTQPDVRARFEREAKTISSLNHPHICTLHDIGREGDTDFLVMELVDGETLAQRLARGALPPADVLRLGGQIADALDRAHRAGVIHRDLKPGNVMLTKSGAKLMDFGLARASDLAGPTSSSGVTMAALSRTQPGASPLTAEGTLVGTFQYMAPEQLEGGDADARSDLWALGCVLYEMATGTRAFEGKSQASLIVSIMSHEPPVISQVAPLAPQALDNLVRALLAKDPDERVQTAHDVRLQLQWMTGGSQASGAVSGVTAAPAVSVASKHSRVPRLAWIAGALVALAAFAAGVLLMPALRGASRAAGPPLRLTVALPKNLRFSGAGGDIELAPDGSALAFVAADTTGITKIYVQPLDGRAAFALDGTDDGFMPFWSPDAKAIAFFAGDKLRRVSLTGGMPQDICSAASPRGGNWGADDVILFAPGADSPIFRVSAKGGTPVAATAIDTSLHETGHRFPRFLPDGRHFVYASTPAVDGLHKIYFTQVGSNARHFVLGSDCSPTYTPDGYLLSRHNSLVYAQRFDPRSGRLSGEPREFLAASQGGGFQASPCIFAASSGVLAFVPPAPQDERLAWVDRAGHITPVESAPVGGWGALQFSRDGTRVVAPRASAQETASAGVSIWIVEVARGVASRLTFSSSIEISPVWSPDGKRVIYTSVVQGAYRAYAKSATGAGDPVFVCRGPGFVWSADAWSPDGATVLFETDDAKTAKDVWAVSMDAAHRQAPLLHSTYSESDARFAPDGHWISYTSDESGRDEIYAQAYPGLGSKVQISTNGGTDAQWSPAGRELFFRAPDGAIMAVPVTMSPTLSVGAPQRLFTPAVRMDGFAVAPDGRRFLTSISGSTASQVAPQIVVNWTGLLKHE